MDHSTLLYLFIFLAAASLALLLASRFKLGSVLGFLAAGILIGPYGFAFIADSGDILHFSELGVILMLFLIGLELEPAMLWRMRQSIIGLGGLQVLLTSLAFTAIGVALGYDARVSAACGMALSLSSTALVLQILQEQNLLQTSMGQHSFSTLLFQDIAVIPILALLPLLAAGSPGAAPHAESLLAGLPVWLRALSVVGVVAGLVLAGRYLSRHLFYWIAKTNLREAFTVASLAIVVGIALLMQAIGVSPALGTFVAGVVLAHSKYRHVLETDLEPFKGLLLGLFFVSIGMGMDFGILKQNPAALIGAVAGLIIVKAALLYALGRFFGLTEAQNVGFALALSQGGEFAFVLFQFAGGLRILNPEQAAFLTLVVAISIACTPVLMLVYNQWIVPRFMSVLPAREPDRITERNAVILAGYGRFGQVIGRFLTAQGVGVTILENSPDQVETLRKFAFKGYFGDASRMDLLQSAGAAKAKLLIVAVDDADTCLTIVRRARERFPKLKILARARNRRHAFELSRLGVDYFRREVFDSSLMMAQEAMRLLGHDAAEMRRKAQAFTRHDEATLQKSFEFFEREPELVSFAVQAAGELEKILQSDLSKTDKP